MQFLLLQALIFKTMRWGSAGVCLQVPPPRWSMAAAVCRPNAVWPFNWFVPAGLKLIKANSTPLKTPTLPRPVDSVQLKDIVFYLSLLEGGRPEDKLECESFSPDQELLSNELENIISYKPEVNKQNQMEGGLPINLNWIIFAQINVNSIFIF